MILVASQFYTNVWGAIHTRCWVAGGQRCRRLCSLRPFSRAMWGFLEEEEGRDFPLVELQEAPAHARRCTVNGTGTVPCSEAQSC